MLELKLKPASGTLPANTLENRQPRNKMLALALLLVTFVVLIAKNHDFWFGDDESADADVVNADSTPVNPAPLAPVARHSVSPTIAATKKEARIQTGTTATAVQTEKIALPAKPAIVATNRAAIAPLGIEVVSGEKHSSPHTANTSTKLEITSTAAPATNAAERVPMSTSIMTTNIPATSTTIPATATPDSYPMLSQQMKVQGSVVLQAIIGADGNIQDLRVIAGPAILTSAAQQAVRQWRFKPYMQNGQAVETKARITVNFTINVGDNSPKIS